MSTVASSLGSFATNTMYDPSLTRKDDEVQVDCYRLLQSCAANTKVVSNKERFPLNRERIKIFDDKPSSDKS